MSDEITARIDDTLRRLAAGLTPQVRADLSWHVDRATGDAAVAAVEALGGEAIRELVIERFRVLALADEGEQMGGLSRSPTHPHYRLRRR
jgi:hypothetical protein